jgi:hypothetical protein
MKTRSTRLLVAVSLMAALSGGCLATTPARDVPSEDAAQADDPTPSDRQQPEDAAADDEPSATVNEPDCLLAPPWTAC